MPENIQFKRNKLKNRESRPNKTKVVYQLDLARGKSN